MFYIQQQLDTEDMLELLHQLDEADWKFLLEESEIEVFILESIKETIENILEGEHD